MGKTVEEKDVDMRSFDMFYNHFIVCLCPVRPLVMGHPWAYTSAAHCSATGLDPEETFSLYML
jgi:hypothetical protein